MKIDERHLVQVAAVVQAGGVTEAAASLGMSQPAISRTLAILERRLGQPLFMKGRRPLVPTPLGTALAEHGQVILLASRRAADAVQSFRGGESGLLRIGGTPFFLDALISSMIAEFQERHGEVRVEQSYGYTLELISQLKADRIDMAICPIDVFDAGSGLVFEEILPGRNVVACRATHPLLSRRRLRTEQLLDFPWVAPPPGSPLYADLRRILYSLGASEVRIRYSGGSLAGVLNYLRASDALAILPHSVVFAFRNDRQISALPVKIEHPDRALGLLRLASAPPFPALDRFGRHVSKGFASLRLLIKRHEQSVVWGG